VPRAPGHRTRPDTARARTPHAIDRYVTDVPEPPNAVDIPLPR
jgi:hypothetical protein